MNLKQILICSLALSLSSCALFKEKPGSKRPEAPAFEHEALKGPSKASQEAPFSTTETKEVTIPQKEEGALESFIEEWYGTPHRMGGMTKKGVDCSGFVIISYREVFDRNFQGRRAEDLFSEMEVIDEEELNYGDLVFFKVRGRRIDHVGIYLQNGDFAHTSSSKGVMISNLSNSYWSKRFFKAARYKD